MRALFSLLCALQLFRPLRKFPRKFLSANCNRLISNATQMFTCLFINPRIINLTEDLISSPSHLSIAILSDFRTTEVLFLFSIGGFPPKYLNTFAKRCKRPCVFYSLVRHYFLRRTTFIAKIAFILPWKVFCVK